MSCIEVINLHPMVIMMMTTTTMLLAADDDVDDNDLLRFFFFFSSVHARELSGLPDVQQPYHVLPVPRLAGPNHDLRVQLLWRGPHPALPRQRNLQSLCPWVRHRSTRSASRLTPLTWNTFCSGLSVFGWSNDVIGAVWLTETVSILFRNWMTGLFFFLLTESVELT